MGGKAKAKPHAENQTLYDFTENVYDAGVLILAGMITVYGSAMTC